jgi:F0F1-type ATP synthase membrane subunit b/b'
MTKKKTTKKRAAKKTTAKCERQAAKYQLAGELSDTAAEIAEQVKDKLTTKQTPERVVAFYLTAWKKAGVVKAVA